MKSRALHEISSRLSSLVSSLPSDVVHKMNEILHRLSTVKSILSIPDALAVVYISIIGCCYGRTLLNKLGTYISNLHEIGCHARSIAKLMGIDLLYYEKASCIEKVASICRSNGICVDVSEIERFFDLVSKTLKRSYSPPTVAALFVNEKCNVSITSASQLFAVSTTSIYNLKKDLERALKGK